MMFGVPHLATLISYHRCASREGFGKLAYSYIAHEWNKKSPELRDWLRRAAMNWRKEPAVKRIEHPTRIDKARRMGFKGKRGYVIVRVRLRRGGARKPRPPSGRRQKAMGVTKYTRAVSIQEIAAKRAGQRYPNMTVKNSYYLYSDGRNHWYEVILQDLGVSSEK